MSRRIEIQLTSRPMSKTVAMSAQLYLDRSQISVARANMRARASYELTFDEPDLYAILSALSGEISGWEPPLYLLR